MINENITVAVRLRPLSLEETISTLPSSWEVPGPTSINDIVENKLYIYDRVYSDTPTEQIFEDLGEKLIWKTMEGFNSCIMCYGQSQSGKSFTMTGSSENPLGLLQLSLQAIFAYIKSNLSQEFLVKLSYFEIYNECINDLLRRQNLNLELLDKNVKEYAE